MLKQFLPLRKIVHVVGFCQNVHATPINKYKDTGEKIAEEYDIFENPDLDNLNLQRTPSGDVFDMSKPNDPPMTHFEPGQRKGFKDFVAKLLLGLY